MTLEGCGLQLDFPSPPSAAKIVDGSLEDLEQRRRVAAEDRLRAEGFAEATQGAAQVLEQAASALDEQRQQLIDSVAETAASLAVEISQELLRKELSEGNYDIAAIVREALAVAGSSTGGTTLRVNPEDAAALSEVPFRAGTEIQADPAIRRGDVLVRTDQGLLVREIDECVAKIRDNLKEALHTC